MSRLRSYLIIDPLVVLATIVMGSLSMAASLFDKSGRAQHKIARMWSRIVLAVCGVRAQVEGIEKLDPHGSYVLVANHLSLIDTPMVLANVPLQFRFFAKYGLFRIPFLGGHLRRAGHLPVIFDNPRASFKSLSEGARLLRQRSLSVLLFPEGGRSTDGLHEFHEGAAFLAIRAGVPAVPIGISGTRDILPMHSLHVRPGRARLIIGDPIPTAGMKMPDRPELNRQLHDRVAELMGASPAGVR